MPHPEWIQSTIVYLSAAVICVPLFRKLGLGAILGYLVAGIIIGPSGLKIISETEQLLTLAEFGVIMLLFLIGLEIAPRKLWEMRRSVGFTGSGQLLISAGLLCLGLFFVTDSWNLSLILALTLGLSSTAFAIQLMAEYEILPTPLGRQGFSILLLQDIAVVPILFFVGSLSSEGTASSGDILFSVAVLMSVILFGKFALNPLLRIISHYGNREVMTAASLLIVVGVAELMIQAGLSMGLGAFIAGLLLANSKFRHQLETDIEPFKGILLGLFFIAVGMQMNMALFLEKPFLILGGALALMGIKTLVVVCLLRVQKFSMRESLFLGVMLCQGGEFGFVILSQATGQGLLSIELSQQVNLIIAFSMLFTVPIALLVKRFVAKPKKVDESHGYDSIDHDEPEVIIAGFGRFGQIIGRLLSASHVPFTALDKDASHVDFIRRFGNKIFYGDASRIDLLRAAGIDHAKLIVIAIDNPEMTIHIAKLIGEYFPNTKIIARARNRTHAYQLYAAGIRNIIRETLESSLQAAALALQEIGYTEGQALEKIDMFRIHDEQMLAEAVKYKDNLEKLIEVSGEGRKELQELFEKD